MKIELAGLPAPKEVGFDPIGESDRVSRVDGEESVKGGNHVQSIAEFARQVMDGSKTGFGFERQDVEDAVEMLNRSAATLNYDIKFNVVPEEGLLQVHINDADSGELIRAIPPDNVLEVRQRVRAFLGLLLDEEV